MKATIEFNLPEEKDELTLATKGPNYYFALQEFSEHIRRVVRGKIEFEGSIDTVEHVLDIFNEILDDNNVDLNEVQ